MTASGDLVGRAPVCAVLDQLVADARNGASGVLVIRGEPGVGKSALLGHAVETARGMRVLRATGVEAESGWPFAGLHQLLRPVIGLLDRIPHNQAAALRGALGMAEPSGDRFLLGVAVLSLLGEAAEPEGVLALVDDAQWLDTESADAVLFSARRVQSDGVALLIAARDDPARPFPAPGLPTIALRGLSVEAAADLLAGSGGPSRAPSAAHALIDLTRGNPLALLELPKALTAAQRSGQEPLPDPLPVGERLQAAFLDEVARLGPDAQALLLLAAAEPSGELDVLLRAADVMSVSQAALDDSERAGLVRIEGNVVRFRHPLIRSALYRGATYVRRRSVHQALADVIAEDQPDRRAWHRAAVAESPDPGLAQELEDSAGRAATHGGHAAAAATLERAAQLTSDPTDRARRLVAAAEAAWQAGRFEQTRALTDQALALGADPRLAREIAYLRGLVELHTGHAATAADQLEAVALAAADHTPDRAALMLAAAMEAISVSGDLSRMPRLLPVAERVRVAGPEAGVLDMIRGLAALYSGDVSGGYALLRGFVDRARNSADPRQLVWAGSAAVYLGDEMTARACYLRAVTLARSTGSLATLPMSLAVLALAEAHSGHIALAESDAEEGHRLATELGQAHWTPITLAALARVAAYRGRQGEAQSMAEEAIRSAMRHGMAAPIGVCVSALADLELAQNRPEDALGRIRSLLAGEHGPPHPIIAIDLVPDHVEAAVRSGVDAPIADLERFDAFATYAAAPWALPLARRCRALLSSGDDADRLFREALDLHHATTRPLDLARTRLLYGEHLRRQKARRAAADHLRTALADFQTLGARAWAARAEAELRACGQTPVTARHDLFDELSPQELQIVRLVSEGLTNRQVAAQLFLSPRTVEYHLAKVYPRLQVTSRTDLVRAYTMRVNRGAAASHPDEVDTPTPGT